MSRVIIFNGPPRSGKDTAVNTIWQAAAVPCQHIKMAEPIVNSVRSLFGVSPEQWDYIYNNHKDEPLEILLGRSPRELCIWMSERVIKPKFGKDFFGKIAARKCLELMSSDYPVNVLMSDGGFLEEVQCVVDTVGSEHTVLVHLHRPGFDFAGDSRSLLDPTALGILPSNYASVINCGDVHDFQQQLISRVLPLLTASE